MASNRDNARLEGNFCPDNQREERPDGANRHGINPANKQAPTAGPSSDGENLNDAVAAARPRFVTWSQVPYEERRRTTLPMPMRSRLTRQASHRFSRESREDRCVSSTSIVHFPLLGMSQG